jgi:carboxylate-amine ligase
VEDDYLVYTFNRFQACRFGLEGEIVDPKTKQRQKVRDDIIRTLARVAEHALDLRSLEANNQIRDSLSDGNDATWLRTQRQSGTPMPAVVEAASARWMMK